MQAPTSEASSCLKLVPWTITIITIMCITLGFRATVSSSSNASWVHQFWFLMNNVITSISLIIFPVLLRKASSNYYGGYFGGNQNGNNNKNNNRNGFNGMYEQRWVSQDAMTFPLHLLRSIVLHLMSCTVSASSTLNCARPHPALRLVRKAPTTSLIWMNSSTPTWNLSWAFNSITVNVSNLRSKLACSSLF